MKDAREIAHWGRNRRMERDKKELSNGCIWSLILLAIILFWIAVGMICCGGRSG